MTQVFSLSKQETLTIGACTAVASTVCYYLFVSYREFNKRRKESVGRISGLYVYPIKSCAGISVSEMEIIDSGLKFDRLYMIIDPNNKNRFLTQRQLPRMALLQPKLPFDFESPLIIQGIGVPPTRVPVLKASPENKEIDVIVWGEKLKAVDQGNSIALWLSAFLNKEVRLVRFSDSFVRPLDINYASKGSTTKFADGFPYLICNEASINNLTEKVNEMKLQKEELQLANPLSILRFRPNIIVEGPNAFEEDFWERVLFVQNRKNGRQTTEESKVALSIVKPCTRCQIPNLDPDSKNPTKNNTITEALREYHTGTNIGLAWGKEKKKFLRETIFGQNAIHDEKQIGKKLAVGDTLFVTKKKNSFNIFSEIFY